MTSPLPAGKIMAIEVATRTTSVFSVLGSTFIITTFLWFPFFRKPINRLVFFATWGNILANVATLMSTSAIPKHRDMLSQLCEFQGVLIQWFMMADSLWVFCMALNVFLVFFYAYDSHQLRHLEKWYLLFAYGVPAIPALIYVILDHTGHRILGPATLWCWVAKEVDWMRITFFYAPVWIVVTATLTIYIVTGLRIFQKRALLQSFSRQSRQLPVVEESSANPFTGGNNIVVTTQIKYDVEHEISRCVLSEGDRESISTFASTRNLSNVGRLDEQASASLPMAPAIRTHQNHRKSAETQTSGNGRSGYRATAFATNSTTGSAMGQTGHSQVNPPIRIRTAEGNAAAMAYLRVAFLMFIALFVVWVPSSLNRLYQFIHKDRPSYGLNIISATVLPLQGAWNAIIYIFTTRAECKRAYGLVESKFTGQPPRYQPRNDTYREDTMTSSRHTRDSDAEITLGDMFKQGDEVRHIEVSSPDSVADPKPYRSQEQR
ncbi:family A G protein-coupled receptor-like protein [Cucurbitaria berberidis CBS 394.84]|uniref:Family A G protein-coupled receptor-like protein n=1 Tax=Cucurbitaria berberidis CBS 394.84 TaxID=1168544 RepID=A0A9P4GA14_9PLEO|nr:family A G protein-coupled receptor-like protein [Cucurbitaria berberidis CBS 394.84]KAF1841632.1 family A G protein-coupled receptor-like protein [Cucurbitaria berberidis CBS 394.84]